MTLSFVPSGLQLLRDGAGPIIYMKPYAEPGV